MTRNAKRGQGLMRCLLKGRGYVWLLCSLSIATLFILFFSKISPFDGQMTLPQAAKIQLVLSARTAQVKLRDATYELQSLEAIFKSLPVGSFIVQNEFLSCLAASSSLAGGEFCLGILLEKNVLHFYVVSSEGDLSHFFELMKKNKRHRACLLQDSSQCASGINCRTQESASQGNSRQISALVVENPSRPNSVIRQQIIHVTVLHEAAGNFWISSPVSSDQAGHVCTEPLPAMDDILIKSVSSGQPAMVFKKFSLEVVRSKFLKTPLLTPANPKTFLQQLDASEYISCNKTSAKLFGDKHAVVENEEEDRLFRSRVRNLLIRIERILHQLHIPWWISSGTCLGWYRQCDIIPYSQDVDIGIWAKDFQPSLIDGLERKGLELIYRLGMANDSLQLSFAYKDTKLDIYFFYTEEKHVWNGATAYHAGQKFKYTFLKFKLCWTIFLEVVVRVPCQALQYIEANYGLNWSEAVQEWDWRISPPNSQLNGFWSMEERQQAIYLNPKYYATDSTAEPERATLFR